MYKDDDNDTWEALPTGKWLQTTVRPLCQEAVYITQLGNSAWCSMPGVRRREKAMAQSFADSYSPSHYEMQHELNRMVHNMFH